MTYDFTTTLELSFAQHGETTKLTFTDAEGMTITSALEKVFTFLGSVYGYDVTNHARELLGPYDGEE
jgi:hypothetical protein